MPSENVMSVEDKVSPISGVFVLVFWLGSKEEEPSLGSVESPVS